MGDAPAAQVDGHRRDHVIGFRGFHWTHQRARDGAAHLAAKIRPVDKGLKATVEAAFDAVLRQHAGRELVRLAQEGGIELANEEVERQAWGD